MTEADLRAIALVRAVEQTSSDLIPQTAVVDATLVAGDAQTDPASWLARRAHHLLAGPLVRFRPAVDHLELHVGTLAWILPAAFLLGLSGNYLGPNRKIHVLLNPIGLLVLWNIAVYAVLALHRLHAMRHGDASATAPPAEVPPGSPGAPPRVRSIRSRQPRGGRGGFFERLLLGGLMRRAVAAQITARSMWDGVRSAGELVRAFVANWVASMRPALQHAVRCALHLGAIGMALGAVVGMYVRGLRLDYVMIWRSTFLTDPDVVAGILRVLLKPAALVLGAAVPTAADAAVLMSKAGSPAAPWIHLLAATVLLVVVVPRLVLAVVSVVAFRRTTARLAPALDDPYVRDLLARAERCDAKEVQNGIRVDVGKAFEGFVDRLADFVALELHEKRIEPALDDFRDNGGRLADLETQLSERCAAFEPTLRAEIGRQQRELERQVTERIAWRLGELSPQHVNGSDVLERVGGAASSASLQAGDRVSDNVATGVSAVVTGALGAVAGTVSGGFGHSLGTALLVGLFHSGPVAWVVGALVGAVATGAGLYLGKDKLREGVKHVWLPAAVVTLALIRIDKVKREGREQCRRMVRDALAHSFETNQVVERTTAAIWSRLMGVLGDRLRPEPAAE